MMKLIYPLLLLGVLIGGCAKVKEPEFRRLDNFKLKNFGFSEVTVAFKVAFLNPNNFKVAVKEAAADVYLDSVYLGKFTQDSAVAVGRQAEFSIPLSGTISTLTALKLDLKNIDQREILLQAKGSVRVGRAGIFTTKDFNYTGRHHLSDIQLGGLLGK